MIGILSLSPADRTKNLQVGDFVTLEIVVEEKIPSAGEDWKIKEATGKKWFSSGSFTLLPSSLAVGEGEGNTTKLSVQAIVHQPGPMESQPFSLLHSGAEVTVAAQHFSQQVAGSAQGEGQPQWFLPPVSFGGWNYGLLIFLTLLAVSLLGWAGSRYWKKRKASRKRTHKEEALLAIQELQKFARSKSGPQQAEWKKFSFTLADLLRKYVNENFSMDSSDMTDRELLSELRFRPKAATHAESLAAILSTIDEVRYGKKELDSNLVPELLMNARKFVELTYMEKEKE